MKFLTIAFFGLMTFSASAHVTCKGSGLTGAGKLKLKTDTAERTVYQLTLGTTEFLATINHKSSGDDYFVISIQDSPRGKPVWSMSKFNEVPEKSSVTFFQNGYASILECSRK